MGVRSVFRVPERPELKEREIGLQTSQPDLEREVGGGGWGDSLALPKPGDRTSGAQGEQINFFKRQI